MPEQQQSSQAERILSKQLKEDKKLKLSVKEFYEVLGINISEDDLRNDDGSIGVEYIINESLKRISASKSDISEEERKLEVLKKAVPYPNNYVLASLAERSYGEKDAVRSKKKLHGEEILGNWVLLTVAYHNIPGITGAIKSVLVDTVLYKATGGKVGDPNGYIGIAYWNPYTHRVIVVHRGTHNLDGIIDADINGILLNKHIGQINSAITFTDKIIHVIEKINKANTLNIQLSIIGHSLGAWLAPITAFSAKYLTKENDYFVENPKFEETGVHAHTVIFDAPGSEEMLMRIQREVMNKSRSSLIHFLDITNFLSAPNVINACNSQVGDMYRVFIDISDKEKKSWKNMIYNYDLFVHNIKKVKNVFDPNTGEVLKDKDGNVRIKKVEDWPSLLLENPDTKFLEKLSKVVILESLECFTPGLLNKVAKYGFSFVSKPIKWYLELKAELHDFFKIANKYNNFHFDNDNEAACVMVGENTFRTVRYKTRSLGEDYKNRRNLNVFTQSERQFLERYKVLQQFQDVPSAFKLTQLFNVFDDEELKEKTIKLLSECELKRDGTVYSNNLTELIPHIKSMLHFFPGVKNVLKEACQNSSEDILRGIYQSASSAYIALFKDSLDFKKDTSGLEAFLKCGDRKILHTIQSSTFLGTVVVHKILNITETNKYENAFLNLDRIFNLGEEIFISFLQKIKHKYLLVIECDDVLNNGLKEFIKKLFAILLDNHKANAKHLKIIFATEKGSDLSKLISEYVLNNALKCLEESDFDIRFNDLTSDSQNFLLKKTVIFQGKEVPLSKVVKGCDDLDTIIDPETIVELFKSKKIVIGKALPSLGETETFYIDRTLVKRVKVREEILKNANLTDLFAVSNISKEELSRLGNGGEVRNFEDADPDRNNPIRLIVLNKKVEEENFYSLYTEYSDYTIHWLKKDNDVGLIWQKSHGKTLSGLRRYIENYGSDLSEDEFLIDNAAIKTIDVNDISELYENITVVAAEPGMGKTTALTRLGVQKSDDTKWLIRINLVEHKDKLKQNIFAEEGNVVAFLHEFNVSNNITKKLVTSRLNENGSMILLLDGFDEITSEGQSNVVNIIKMLQNKVEKVLISTRLHLRNELENSLSTVAYTLKPFSLEDQKEFLNKFWKKNLGATIDEHSLDIYINKLLQFISKSIDDKERSFMGIPMQMRMIAEAFQDVTKNKELLKHPEWTFPDSFNMLQLYDRFIQAKYLTYFEKIGAGSIDLSQPTRKDWLITKMREVHEKLAFKLLFSDIEPEAMNSLIGEEESISETDKQEINLVGITQIIDDRIVFTHRTFGEYFAANFLAGRLNQKKNKQEYDTTVDFLVKELFKCKNEVIRTLLDYCLAKEAINVAILKGKQDDVRNILLKGNKDVVHITDALGRSVVHLAAQEGLKEIVTILLENNEIDIEKTDKLGKTVLHYAARYNEGADIVDLLLKRNKSYLNACDYNNRTALYYAAHQGNWDIVDRILTEDGASDEGLETEKLLFHYTYKGNFDVVRNLVRSKKIDVIAIKDNHGNTLLHIATQKGHLNIVNFLLKIGADVGVSNNSGKRTISYAAEKGHWGIVVSLLKRGAKFNELSDDQKLSLLKYSTKYNHWGIVKLFMVDDGKVNYFRDLTGPQRVELLCHSILFGNFNVVDFLTKQDIAFNDSDEYGVRPIYYAARNEYWYIVESLLRKNADPKYLIKKQKFSLLEHSALNYNWDIVNLFMKSDMNNCFNYLSDEQKIHFLHYLISVGNLNITRSFINKLIENKIISNVNSPNSCGKTFLHLAAQCGKLNIVQYLVEEKGADVNANINSRSTPLHLAAQNGHLETVKYLVDKRADLIVTNTDGKTPANLATEKGYKNIVQFLEQAQQDILVDSAKQGNLSVVKELLNNGADVNTRSSNGNIPLLEAATYGHLNVVKYLVEEGANLKVIDKDGKDSLHLAAQCGKLAVVQYLIESKGVDFREADKYGSTPLHSAARHDELEVVHYIMDRTAGFKVSYRLHWAAKNGYAPVVKLLVEKGANVNLKDNDGFTVLHFAVESGNLDVVKYLIQKKADLNAKDNYGRISLQLAADKGKLEIVQYLIDKIVGFKINYKLHWAAKNGYTEVVKLLIEKGENLSLKNSQDQTPLHLAAENGKLEVVKYLIKLNADLNSKDNYGRTPLHLAAREGKLEAVQYIVGKLANIHAEDNNYKISLELAAKNNHFEVVVYLKEEEAKLFCKQNRYNEAFISYQDIFKERKSKLGLEHPDTLTTLNNMAVVLSKHAETLFNQGKYRDAYRVYMEVFHIQKEPNVLGPDHRNTLMTRINTAVVLSKLGVYKEALEILDDVLNAKSNSEDSVLNQRDILTCRHNKAEVFYKQGKYKDALELYEEVREKREKMLEANHPDILITRHHVARVLNNQGKHKISLDRFRNIFGLQCEKLGSDHPDTLKTHHNIAFTYYRLNKCPEASNIIQDVLQKRERVLGYNHPDTLTTRHVKALLLIELREYEEALNNLNDIFQIQEDILGLDHSDTLATKHDIAYVLYSLGRGREALRMFEEVYKKRVEVLGSHHLYTSYSYDCMISAKLTNKCSIQHYEKEQKNFSDLSMLVSHCFSQVQIASVNQGIYLSSFKKRGIKIKGKCVVITRGFSQALLSHSEKYFLNNLQTSADIFERIAQGKQISKRKEREVFAFSKLLNSFEIELDSVSNSLPSNLICNRECRSLDNLSRYVAGLEGDFAIHLVTSDHVVSIYRTGDTYAYFDCNVAFIYGLKSASQLIQVLEKGMTSAGYQIEGKGLLAEHFDVVKANSQLSVENKEILEKEIKTERQLLEEQDIELGLININGREFSRVHLYDFGTKISVEGSVPLLINVDMNLSGDKFRDFLGEKKVCMTAREYLDSLKGSKNVEQIARATKCIPFMGSKREVKKAEQTRKLKWL